MASSMACFLVFASGAASLALPLEVCFGARDETIRIQSTWLALVVAWGMIASHPAVLHLRPRPGVPALLGAIAVMLLALVLNVLVAVGGMAITMLVMPLRVAFEPE